MKVCTFRINEICPGKHNLKDPRLDHAHTLVEAKKKVHAQIETVEEKDLSVSEAILVRRANVEDLILKDLELIDARLGRDPDETEQASLIRLYAELESGKTVREATLDEADRTTLSIHSFVTDRPIIVVTEEDLVAADELLLRVYREAGYISFLTVGGSENRAWKIRQGTSAWEAAGVVHSDMQRGFIRAEIISYEDFVAAGGETEAKREGKQRLERKTYIIQDYDLVNFRFNKS
ncbi:MAG: DUF933 domain-containing protein [Pseudomonadota bacterium]